MAVDTCVPGKLARCLGLPATQNPLAAEKQLVGAYSAWLSTFTGPTTGSFCTEDIFVIALEPFMQQNAPSVSVNM